MTIVAFVTVTSYTSSPFVFLGATKNENSCRVDRDKKPRLSGAFGRLRGKDSNLDYLIQSQASYR
jgi:hypothetical protein